MKGRPRIAVKLFPCDHEVMGSSLGKEPLAEMLRTLDPKWLDPSSDPVQAVATCTRLPFFQSMLTINYNTLDVSPYLLGSILVIFFTYQDLCPRARMILDEGIMYYHQVNNVSLKTIK
jgi:hypothetical protein